MSESAEENFAIGEDETRILIKWDRETGIFKLFSEGVYVTIKDLEAVFTEIVKIFKDNPDKTEIYEEDKEDKEDIETSNIPPWLKGNK